LYKRIISRFVSYQFRGYQLYGSQILKNVKRIQCGSSSFPS